MRTTVTVDDHLLATLKKRAAASGTPVSRLVEQAIRLLLQTPRAASQKSGFELVTFGRGGSFSARDIDKTSSLVEADDLDRFVGRG